MQARTRFAHCECCSRDCRTDHDEPCDVCQLDDPWWEEEDE